MLLIQLLVSWSGIEFFEHHSKEVVREECLSLEILQVNEVGKISKIELSQIFKV